MVADGMPIPAIDFVYNLLRSLFLQLVAYTRSPHQPEGAPRPVHLAQPGTVETLCGAIWTRQEWIEDDAQVVVCKTCSRRLTALYAKRDKLILLLDSGSS